MADNVVYNTTGSLTPKQRLQRLILGLLAELRQQNPLVSTEENQMRLGLVLQANRRTIVNKSLAQLG
jgi:hypothetical protein